MLREVVGTFLDTLTEREFDAPLLALLASQGFTDIHFIHGSFEFGKDVIAKRVNPATGIASQYAIQSKAGDIGQAAWREVRPQLEEAEYNTRAHPGYDDALPRVAVLLTTGRLKGAAGTDAQEYKEKAASRGLAGFEVWERTTLADWMCVDPSIGLVGNSTEPDLMALVADIRLQRVAEPMIERYTRAWLPSAPNARFDPRCAVESALIVNSLRLAKRHDLAALAALHLLRAASVDYSACGGTADHGTAEIQHKLRSTARSLFTSCAAEVLAQVEPFLDDPIDLVRATADPVGLVIYPAVCTRVIELLALLVVANSDDNWVGRARDVVSRLALAHPGCHRPPSDQFAAAVIPAVAVIAREDMSAARSFLVRVTKWMLDRHDPALCGLGLSSIDDTEEIVTERLLGGALDATKVEPRYASYVSTVVLDLCIALDAHDLYEAAKDNIMALRIVPCSTSASERGAHWRRGGQGVHWLPRIEYGSWGSPRPAHHALLSEVDSRDALLLGAVCRSRHNVAAIRTFISGTPSGSLQMKPCPTRE